MTKQATAEVVHDKDLTALVEVIGPKDLDTKTRNTLVSIAAGFLNSLNEREEEARAKTLVRLADVELNRLIDQKTGIAIIKTQEDANLSGKLCKDLAETVKEIGEAWEKETNFFNRFHKTLTGRRSECQTALNGVITKLKDGARIWLLKEQERVRQAQAAAQAKIDAQFRIEQEKARVAQAAAQAKIDKEYKKAGIKEPPPTIPLDMPMEPPPAVVFDKPKIGGPGGGLSGKTTWHYRADLMGLVKAVAKGKAPLSALQVNDDWLSEDVTLNHDRAVENPETKKKYLYEGTVEVYSDIQMARR